jgi:beta-xylosidase
MSKWLKEIRSACARNAGQIIPAIFGLLAVSFLGGCCSICSTKPEAQYTNPVYEGSMPDPSVIRHDGWYYAFGTTGAGRLEDGRIFTVLRSKDLVNWVKLGGALVPPSPNPKFQYWAPDVTFEKGKFYLYYSMGGVQDEKFDLRVAVSESPQGPYIDAGEKLVDCENNRFTIDSYPFKDSDGQWYLFYARNFTDQTPAGASGGPVHPGTAIVVDRLIDMTKLARDCKVVVRAKHDWTLYEANRRMDVYDNTFNWHTIEGPCVVKHKGKYYCFYSGSNWQSDHYGADYVVADKPMGPYSGQGTSPRVLHGIPGKVRGPGHHSIATGPKGKSNYIVYHAWDAGMKRRQLCIDKLIWTPEGPKCVGPTFTPQPAPR